MLWFILHNILKNISTIDNQFRNLTTFLIGITLYVLMYSYIGSLDLSGNPFFKSLFGFFIYIIFADGFAMAIIYKNFYKQTIFTEVSETIGSPIITPIITPTIAEEINENFVEEIAEATVIDVNVNNENH